MLRLSQKTYQTQQHFGAGFVGKPKSNIIGTMLSHLKARQLNLFDN